MEKYVLRVGISKPHYAKMTHIFSLGHYIPKDEKEDAFSKDIHYFYKYCTKLDDFVHKLKDLYELRFGGDEIKFDYITLYPTRDKNGINDNMINLVKQLSEEIHVPYEQLLRRNKTIEPNHKLKTFEERIHNIKGSVDLVKDVRGKNIIVLDNVSTTGTSLIDATNLLLDNGANIVVCMTLGLASKEKEKDWVDLNHTLKYSKIFSNPKLCKPHVPQENYEKWKKR